VPSPLSPGMARALAEWKDTTDYRGHDDPVFASAVGTPLGYSNVHNRVLRPALKARRLDGQGVAFHAFRKACGSMLLLRAGKDPRQVQRLLGHSQLTTTMNVYVHELDDGLGGADNLDGLWGHRGTPKPADSRKRDRPRAAESRVESGSRRQQRSPGLVMSPLL
jgi:Phage integrase family